MAAQRGEDLNTRLTATDQASAVVDKLAAKVGDLEDSPHEVDMTADTADVQREIETLDRRLAGLSDEEKAIVLRASATQAQREVDKFTRQLADAKKLSDEEVTLRVEARGNAQARLQAIQSELRELDGKNVTPTVNVRGLDDTLSKLDQIGVSLGPAGALGQLGSGAGIFGALAIGAKLLADSTTTQAIAARDLSTLTGSQIEDASRLNALWMTTGAEVKDLQDVLLQMNGVLATTPDLGAKLGVNTNDGANLIERFVQISDALDRIPAGAERSQIASQLFGEEGVRQYNALRNSVDDVSAALDNVADKSVFTTADAEEAQEYRQAINDIKTELNAVATDTGGRVVPNLVTMLGLLREIRDGEWAPGGDLPDWIGEADSKVRSFLLGFGPAEDALNRYRESGLGAEISTSMLADIQQRLNDTYAESVTRADASRAAADRLGGVLGDTWDAVLTGARDAVTEVGAVETAADRATTAFERMGGMFDLALGRLSEESSLIGITEQFQRVLETASQDGGEAAADQRKELISLAERVVAYAKTVEDIDPDKVFRLIAAIEEGDLLEVQMRLADLTADRSIRIRFDVDDPSGPIQFRVSGTGNAPVIVQTAGGGGNVVAGGGGSGPVSASTLAALEQIGSWLSPGGMNVTNNYFGQPTTEQVAAAEREYIFRNGPGNPQ
jgi:hypothetical protein